MSYFSTYSKFETRAFEFSHYLRSCVSGSGILTNSPVDENQCLEKYTVSDGEPMEFNQYRSDVFMFLGMGDEAGSSVLGTLKFLNSHSGSPDCTCYNSLV